MNLTERQTKLLQYVKDSHGDQKRKYTGEPYWNHVYAVAEIVADIDPKGIEIALCHDLFEDTLVWTPDLILFLTNNEYSKEEALFIAKGVLDLTDVFTKKNYPSLNRAARKTQEAKRLGKICSLSQTVKYADLIDNTKSIVENDKGFAKVYLYEKRQMLEVMRRGNFDLLERCERQISEI